ncbi:MAG: putative transposase, partial [Leptospirillum sp. Group IV 'UBA BS']
ETFQASSVYKRVRALGIVYLAGLCSNLVRKSVEPIALAMNVGVRSLQRLMTGRDWDEDAMRHLYKEQLAREIASVTPEEISLSMITVDDSSFVKKGKESVGVARQYCGRLGKVDNCQSGVFAGFAGPRGHGLLDSRLYMPQEWFSETEEFAERRKKTGVPKDLVFKTKPEIAAEMIGALRKEGRFPARWIGCDSAYGSNRAFLNALSPDLWYFAAIKGNTRVLMEPPVWKVPERKGTRGAAPTRLRLTEKPRTVAEIAKTASFMPIILKEGSKGPLGAFVCALRVSPVPDTEGAQSRAEWLILLKTPDGEMKFAFSNAPETTSLETFGFVSTLRWSIEQCFLEDKSYLGMSHYEHRSWRAWNRHMLYVFLAHLFITTVRRHLGEKKRGLPFPWPNNSRPPRSLPRCSTRQARSTS